MKKDIILDKGIEITREDKRITISQGGVMIRHEGKPVKNKKNKMIGFVYLLIDCSDSMSWEGKLNQAKNGAIKFAREAKAKGYLIGLIQFGDPATHLCKLQRKISVLHQHLRSMEAVGGTNMTDAILLATQKLIERNGSQAIVIVTDGMPDNRLTALEAAQQAKKNGIDIITIGIGTDDVDERFLKQLASRSELAVKVSTVHFEQAITSAAKLLLAQRGG